jgi:tetratricopeptide (TPR) repeat protein
MHRIKKWTETYTQLSQADLEDKLDSSELETLAVAAYLTGNDANSFQILERAHLSYLEEEKTEQAVRCAFWLGFMLMNAGEKARSNGWMARGERLLRDKPECAEKGLLLIPAALGELSVGQGEKAQKLFEQVSKIGEQFGDANLMALGRLGHGQAMIQQGEVANGIKLLDEAMIIVETDEVFPVVNGIVYCAVIETCRQVWDLRRAQEWTTAFSRWCDAQPDIVPFRGQCLVCRAEIIQFHGDWRNALEEINDACKLLRIKSELIAGEAYYRKAELNRLMGDFKEAEDDYHEAAKLGRKPQPGLALLRLAQRQDDAAETSIRNTLRETEVLKKRAELLPEVVRIMIAVKQIKEAREACNELFDIATKLETPYLNGMSAYCQGAVFLAEGNIQHALEHLKNAIKVWDILNLPYETARTKE